MTVSKHILSILLFISSIAGAQTFTNNTTVNIPASNSTLSYFSNSINVTGLPVINGAPFGLEQVEITFKTAQFTNMELFLVSPNGRIIELINIRNGSGNVTGTFILNMTPSNPEIRFWNAASLTSPGSFIPMASLNSVNDGSSPNGVWQLFGRLNLFITFSTNQITDWKLTFGTNNTIPAAPNDDCTGAVNLVNTTATGSFVSGTNKEYGAKLPASGDVTGSSVCSSSGYTENSAWFTWVASCADDSINIQSFTRVQTGVVKGSCTGSFTNVACKVVDNPNNYTYKFTNLTPGARYYLVMDGDNAYYGPFDIRWYPGSCTPLPVTLLNFTAFYDPQSEKVRLHWTTATEKNNKEFIIKAKNYNKTSGFSQVAQVNSYSQNAGSNYEINQSPEHDGLYEFQLFQTDVDGTTTYLTHAFVAVNFINESFINILYSEEGPQLSIELNTSDILNLSVTDLNGKTIWSEIKQADAGTNLYSLPSGFSRSLYFLEVRTSDKIECRKLLYK